MASGSRLTRSADQAWQHSQPPVIRKRVRRQVTKPIRAWPFDYSLHPRLELGSNEAIKQAILAGLGISALSRHTLTLNQPGQFAVLDVEGFPILRHWYAVYPAGRQLSVVARAFLDYLLGREDAAPAAPGKKK